MMSYSISQWILFFFYYAFIGWIWECCFVSMKGFYRNRKWKFVNRGFLHGPFIPIYGFVAISILITTVPIRAQGLAVFVVGSLTATIFELVIGPVMEKLFQVKYWDYSELPLNYKGYICLFVSIFWGILSVVLVQIIHVPIADVLMKIPRAVCEICSILLIILFTYDTTISFNEAMELRDLLETLAENNETMKRIERRIDAIVAFTPVPDMNELRVLSENRHAKMEDRVNRLRERNEERINKIRGHMQLPEFDGLPEREEWLKKLEQRHIKFMEKTYKQYTYALSQLKRNPMMKSKKYQEIIKLLNEWNKDER